MVSHDRKCGLDPMTYYFSVSRAACIFVWHADDEQRLALGGNYVEHAKTSITLSGASVQHIDALLGCPPQRLSNDSRVVRGLVLACCRIRDEDRWLKAISIGASCKVAHDVIVSSFQSFDTIRALQK